MKSYPLWKPIVVLLVLLASALVIYPPSLKLKPGLDLAGGTTLVYDVQVPENQQGNAGQVIDDIIAILKNRVDPTGTRNLVWRRQAGNRIEIQMALATAETGDRRAAYDRALEDLFEANITEQALDAALRLDGEARAEKLAELARGNAQTLDQLRALAAAYDNLMAISEPYRAAQEAYRDAQDRLAEVTQSQTATIDEKQAAQRAVDEAFERLAPLATDVADARQQFQAARDDVLDQNIEPFEIQTVLDQSTQPRPGESTSPREQALTELKRDHPERVDQIDAVAEAWASYERVKGPLDDPNDLIALLQSSGVLEFRIAPTPDQDIDFEPYRERLAEAGPRAGADEPYRWFEIDSLERYIDEEAQREAVRENAAAALERYRGVVGAEYRGKYFVLLANTPDLAMTQEEDWALADAYRTTDEMGRPAVGFTMDPRGANALSRITRANVGDPMAITLDGRVVTTPTLQAALSNRGIITGNFNQEYVDFLVRTLDSGSLEAQLGDYPILIKTTGPQLGADNLQAGLTAAVLALALVSVFIVFYYFFAGLVATVALAANMLIILGIMALVQATFTLPGIAGIVLTIGMAVDANVLIFERIREELDDGADLGTAIRLGFDKAFSTIVDANLTTFITAVVLFYTATAEIKGFATTLMCGILATLFTSLILSRILMDAYHMLLKARKLPMLPSVFPALGRALSPNVNWVGKRYGFFVVSAIVALSGLGMLFARGENMLDIEFRSGTQVSFEVDYDLDGREVTPPDAVDAEVPQGVEAPLVPIEEIRTRLRLVADAAAGNAFPDDLEPTEARRSAFKRLKVAMDSFREHYRSEIEEKLDKAEQKYTELRERYSNLSSASQGANSLREQLAKAELDRNEIRSELEELESLDPTQLADAQVVTQGTTAGSYASGFSISTLVQDSQFVSSMIKAAYSDLLDEPPRVRFDGIDLERHTRAPVYPVTATDDQGNAVLGLSIDRLDVRNRVDDFLGGAAVVLEDVTPAASVEAIEQRVSRTLRQPPFDELGYRPFRVFGIDAAGTDDQGRTTYQTLALVFSDGATNYVESPGAFDNADGLAAQMWELTRSAAQRDASLESVASFSAQVSDTMRRRAIVAMALSLLAVVAYIWFRFGSIRYGLAAIAALVHDVSIALGLLAISGWLYDNAIGHALLLTDFKIDLAIVAAMLTIVGYSLNDTIVVFDRIRENRGKLAVATPEIINRSINQTISRTVLTSGTTLLAVAILYAFGGPGVHGFAFAMIIGVVVGTYSSIAVASPALLVGIKKKAQAVEAKQAEQAAATTTPATT